MVINLIERFGYKALESYYDWSNIMSSSPGLWNVKAKIGGKTSPAVVFSETTMWQKVDNDMD